MSKDVATDNSFMGFFCFDVTSFQKFLSRVEGLYIVCSDLAFVV